MDEGPAIVLRRNAFHVRRGLDDLSASTIADIPPSSGSFIGSGACRPATVFPSLSGGDERFSSRVTVNRGGSNDDVGLAPADADADGSGRALALYEYAVVDFFVEATGCPTEREFLRLATGVDVRVSYRMDGRVGSGTEGKRRKGQECGAGSGESRERLLAVTLDERGCWGEEEFGDEDVRNAGMWRPAKRRGSSLA